jgi:predicted nucleic acid-binding protein
VSGYLLDTNIISELIKPRPEPRVVRWVDSVEESLLHLSVLTLGEIEKGIAGLPRASRRARLEAWLDAELQPRFSGRILPVDEAVARRWGRIAGALESQSRAKVPVVDGLLAATAIEHGLVLITRNARDVAPTGASVFNPWEDSPL